MHRHGAHQGLPSPVPDTSDTYPENAGNAWAASLEKPHDMFLPLAFEEGFDECPVAENRCDGRSRGRVVNRLDREQACRLYRRLSDGADPIARFLDCELSTPLRAELRTRLKRSCQRSRDAARQEQRPSDPAPGPSP